jgi:hypothetical protein
MTESASAEVLSAQIRVIQVGSGQITRSMYRQLDKVSPERFEAFGRVKDNKLKSGEGVLHLVGRDTKTGALVRCDAQPPPTDWPKRAGPSEYAHWQLHPRHYSSVAESPDGRHLLWTWSEANCPNPYGWHVSQKRPWVLPFLGRWQGFLDWYARRERQSRAACTVDLDKLEQAWRAEAKAQLAEILEKEAKYNKLKALPLIVLPD